MADQTSPKSAISKATAILSRAAGFGAARLVIATVVLLYVLSDCLFIVQPTEMAGLRRLGTVISREPFEPGLHFKAPFIDTADKLQVSIDTFRIENLRVYTVDNQSVQISVGVTYRIPKDAVLKLLYQVGRSGNRDISHNIEQIIADRALRLFAKRNTVKISEEREQIAGDVRVAVSQSVRELFGIEIFDLQIPAVRYSDTFVASVEVAVKAKNDAIAAENTVNRIRYEGEQKVVTARAEAEAQIARAQAQKQSQILASEGEARGIELRAAAEAQSIRVRGEALKENARVIELTLAERWSGQPPQTILGNTSAVPFFNISSDVSKAPQNGTAPR
jgi:regulator of protease activity HflC (stomatin/prohibitin superfamily)